MAHAQRVDAPPLVLKPSSLIDESLTQETRKQLPTFMQSDALKGRTDLETLLNGQVVIRRGDLLIKADQVDYNQVEDLAKARGNVYINRAGNVYKGTALDLHMEAFEGFFTQPTYQLLKNQAHGSADRIDFIDVSNTVMHNADFTTCQRKPGPNWTPDWFFKGEKITLDSDRSEAIAEGASLRFMGVPILPVPAVEFPLGDERKSGLLPPTIGIDNISGLEVTQPYYWNLAPNRDITFFPTYWGKRGLKLGTELRYLESTAPQPPFQGIMRFDYMEHDKLRDGKRRWSMQYGHTGVLNPSYKGGALGLAFNINRVSDDNYWKDFIASDGFGNQRLLSNDITATWAKGLFSSSMTIQKWTTLQDLSNAANNITPPFDRVPQINARFLKNNFHDFDFSIDGQFSRFESKRMQSCEENYLNCNASRAISLAQISRPFLTSYGYLTPKAQVLGRSYQFDGALSTNAQTSAGMTTTTLSLDTGMTFERSSNLFGRAWTQTLEPRAFYVYTPYVEQSFLPNYDSGSNAYNFSSIFTENTFGGYDRISDSKLLTIGATSRFIDPSTGGEAARFAVAQRLRMKEQRVTLLPNDETAKAGISDLLAGANTNLTPSWALDSTVQYNPNTGVFVRRMVGGRYSPGSYRVISAAYRAQNNDTTNEPVSRQIDLNWQWPLHDLWRGADAIVGEGRGLGEGRWYSVAHILYSPLDEKKVVESVMGFEYDAGCWIGRIVSEQAAVSEGTARKRLLFQLEFVGFSRAGFNALGSLRTNIPRYQPLRLPAATPSRFGNYD